MGEHNITRKYIDLAHGDCIYRHGADAQWRCMGCGKTYRKTTIKEIAGLAYAGALPPDYTPHIEVHQENGVVLNVCLLCAALACGKDGETFRMIHPGEFEPHKITARMRKKAWEFFQEWRDEHMSYLQAFADVLPNLREYREEADAYFKETK